MASRIQGITVEIGGDTTKLQNALGIIGFAVFGKIILAFFEFYRKYLVKRRLGR